MKKIKFLCMASMAAMILGACSDDNIGDGTNGSNPGDAENGVFFAINIDMPKAGGSRSTTGDPGNNGSTSTGGVEIGQDYENKINEAIIVLARSSDNGFIAASTVTTNDLHAISADKSAYKALSKFSKTQLSAYYNDKDFSNKANIFVFANPNQGVKDAIFGSDDGATVPAPGVGSTDWVDAVQTLDDENFIWTPDNFLMSNALIAQREIPRLLNDWDNYKSEGKPFDLSGNNADVAIDNGTPVRGSIKVERAAARFDFRDGSENRKGNGIGDFTYQVVYDGVGEAAKTPLINVQLQRMALVNMNKSFYALRRVSADGKPKDTQLCQPERPWSYDATTGELLSSGNYVVDADWEWKDDIATAWNNTVPNKEFAYDDHFEYPFFNNDNTIDVTNAHDPNRWGVSICKAVVEGPEDNNQDWNSDASKGDYHIWRYATENTIAGMNGQINGLTTGSVFKGKMIATSEALESEDEDVRALAEAINNKSEDFGNSYKAPILYLFAGNLYMTWNKIREAAIKAAVPGFKWVGDANTGHWEPFSINRTNSLYVAVFGTGGFGSVTFKYNKVNESGAVIEEGVEITYEDQLSEDETSANYAWNAWNTGGKPDSGALKDNFKKAVTDAKITIYQRSNDEVEGHPELGGWGYYCYYYYWNRHNDNTRSGVMGPMEFAVVRNNVYKLAVTKISRLGHPRISENDPDKPTPGTPDESEDIYLTVTAETLPWVVRENNIEF